MKLVSVAACIRSSRNTLIVTSVILVTNIIISQTAEASHIRHQRNNGSVHQNHLANPDDFQIPIGQMCQSDSECANSSICLSKLFEEDDYDMEMNVCQCDHRQMKRVDHSCLVKPGHQCYYPNKDSHGRTLYSCMEGLLCKSGVNESDPHSGYCMCPDLHFYTDDPHRWLDVQYETHRCSAVSLKTNRRHYLIPTGLIFSIFSAIACTATN